MESGEAEGGGQAMPPPTASSPHHSGDQCGCKVQSLVAKVHS